MPAAGPIDWRIEYKRLLAENNRLASQKHELRKKLETLIYFAKNCPPSDENRALFVTAAINDAEATIRTTA